jgi:hypothetical protein
MLAIDNANSGVRYQTIGDKWYPQTGDKRYPWKHHFKDPRRVTIALGMLASNALVIGADTELGVDDGTALKNERGKIAWASHVKSDVGRIAGLAVTGAGTSSHVRHLQQDLSKLITGPDSQRWSEFDPPTMAEFETAAINCIKTFHSTYVLPFDGHANAPQFYLVFGYHSPDGYAKLWSTNDSLTTESESIAVVGIGAMYATILLNRLFFPMWPMDHRVAILLTAYVLHEVKKHITGCGQESDIVCFGSSFNRQTFIRREQIKELETLFSELTVVQTEGMKLIFEGTGGRGQTARKFDSIRRRIDKVVKSVERLI